METSTVTPRLAIVRLHPIKGLDPVQVKEARIGPGGGLELDRAWALYSADGQWINGKRTAAIHLIRSAYAPDLSSVTLSVPADRLGTPTKTFDFPGGSVDAAQWFSAFFDQSVTVRYAPEGFPDDTVANGPTIISTASLDAAASWFPGLTSMDMRLRFRTTLEIDGVPPFWEDQLFGPDKNILPRFRIGDAHFEGSNPCARCPVPPRNPHTGAEFTGFQKRFTEQRRATLPSWSPLERFDHFYRMSTNTRVTSAESGKLLRVNDPLVLL
ncbi:MAG TPA: MOSC N-terminal beta barrel domain-containing protein [Candidatus Acidoferrum sp.]|nr:MOSC N-terminal beta barrel domain-containing protein [Candidatus Acidoferrum sp.]